MRRFLITCIAFATFLVLSLVGIATPASGATPLYQCVYRWYPYSEIWTTSGTYAMNLNNNGWRCVKWR